MDWRRWQLAASLLVALCVSTLAHTNSFSLSKKIDRPFPGGICPLPAASNLNALTFQASGASMLLTFWRENGNNQSGGHVYQGLPYVAVVRRDFYDGHLSDDSPNGCYNSQDPDTDFRDPARLLLIPAPPNPDQVPFLADFSLPGAFAGWFLCQTAPPASDDPYPDELPLGAELNGSNTYVSASVALTGLQPGANYVVYILWHMEDFDFDDSPTSSDNAPDNLVIRFDPLPLGGAAGCGCDADGDSVGETCDTCPGLNDPGQIDQDGDGRGDLCDLCPLTPDPGQLDGDGDLHGDACDNCPSVTNAAQTDSDGDGTGDACECLNVVCTPSDVCHAAGECNHATGLCSAGPTLPNGTSCSDGNACNGLETCQGGTCAPGTSVTCNNPPACRTASGATCDQQTGACSYPASPNGTSCSDSNACNGLETCQGGTCAPGTSVTCSTPPACRTASGATCDQQTGACSYPASPNGTSCSDSNACNGLETCQGGTCAPGTSVTCSTPPACRTASGATCDQQTGACSYPASPNGTSCSDSNACNGLETCQGGTCAPGTSVTCSTPPACRTASGATCDQQTGACSYPASPNGTSCSDSNACNGLETCQGGTCAPGTSVTCSTPPACRTASGATCDQQTGACSYPASPNGTSCSDSNACNGLETCQGGTCAPGTSVTCSTPPACRTASGATCDQQTGACSYPASPNGTSCSDSNACNGLETCQGGTCAPGTSVTCSTPPACRTASGATCDQQTGACSYPASPNGTSCSDSNACTVADVCTAGACAGRQAVTPELKRLRIDAGDLSTFSRAVSLGLTVQGDAVEILASEDPFFSGAGWQTFAPDISYTLSSGAGRKTVYVLVRACPELESLVKKDVIRLLAPKLVSFALDGGERTTASRDVVLGSVALGDPSEYIASESPDFSGALWRPYTQSAEFTLSADAGRKTVYLKVRNDVGESKARKESITLSGETLR